MSTNVSGTPDSSTTGQTTNELYGADLQLVGANKDGAALTVDIDTAVEMLFLQRSQIMSLQAQDSLVENKDKLRLMQNARTILAQMKEQKETAKHRDDNLAPITPEMKAFLQENNIKTDTSNYDKYHGSDAPVRYSSPDEWDVNIEYLNSFVDKISGESKTQFLELQRKTTSSDDALREASTMIAKHHDLFQSMVQSFGR